MSFGLCGTRDVFVHAVWDESSAPHNISAIGRNVVESSAGSVACKQVGPAIHRKSTGSRIASRGLRSILQSLKKIPARRTGVVAENTFSWLFRFHETEGISWS